MINFLDVLSTWEQMGVFNVLLPFLLVFAITFAILEKIHLFGTEKRNINGIIAAVFGILVVRNQYVIGIINRFLPNISLFMIIILMFLLLVGTFTGKDNATVERTLGKAAMYISGIFVVWALSSDFVGSIFEIPRWLYGFDEQTKATILFIGIFTIAVIIVLKSGGTPPTTPTTTPTTPSAGTGGNV